MVGWGWVLRVIMNEDGLCKWEMSHGDEGKHKEDVDELEGGDMLHCIIRHYPPIEERSSNQMTDADRR